MIAQLYGPSKVEFSVQKENQLSHSADDVEEIVVRMTSSADDIRRKLDLFWQDALSLIQLVSKDSGSGLMERGASLEEIERRVILDALKRHNWHAVAAAKAIGIGKTTMYRRIQEMRKTSARDSLEADVFSA